jgi:hypothetical protein
MLILLLSVAPSWVKELGGANQGREGSRVSLTTFRVLSCPDLGRRDHLRTPNHLDCTGRFLWGRLQVGCPPPRCPT